MYNNYRENNRIKKLIQGFFRKNLFSTWFDMMTMRMMMIYCHMSTLTFEIFVILWCSENYFK